MCGHSDSAEKMIQQIIQKLYPAIDEQFSLITADSENTQIYTALSALKTEFQLLYAYESRLVFPSILKVFNTKHLTELPELPNINELLQLTRHKEQRLLQLVHTFSKEYAKTGAKDLAAEQLILLFDEDFILVKSQWNAIVSGWLKECSCFQRANSFINDKH